MPDGHTSVHFSARQILYIWLVAFFTASLIIADIVGVKLFRLETGLGWTPADPIIHTCGMLVFPVTFILTDLLNEYYGRKAARRAALIAFSMGMFVFAVLNVALAMPHLDADFNVDPAAFAEVFAGSRIMFVASLLAFLAASYLDIFIFGLLKRLTRGKALWLRATGSTVLSQVIDSLLVTYLAFGLGRTLFPDPANPPMPWPTLLQVAATGYLLKFVLAVGITPLIYAGHAVLHRGFGLAPLPPEGADAPPLEAE
ncbi:MAG: queuosine precursor transporter [Phycisphaeraceae bacterium]|nr:MAG: queuosine precursor transporter [Phycisphaeraceae bacterium]